MQSNLGERFDITLTSDPARGAVSMTCEDAHCEAWLNGWVTPLDPLGTPGHAEHARTIEQFCVALGQSHPDATRRCYLKLEAETAAEYLERHGGELGLSPDAGEIARRAAPGSFLYVFPPGQRCFRAHVDRDVVFAQRGPRIARRVHEPLGFNEAFNESAYQLERAIQRG